MPAAAATAAPPSTLSVNEMLAAAAPLLPSKPGQFNYDALPTCGSGGRPRGLGHKLFNPYDDTVKTADPPRRSSGAENAAAYEPSSCLGLSERVCGGSAS